MSALLETLQGPLGLRLASVLLHSLWQATTVAVLVGLVLRRIPATHGEGRYKVALGGMAAIVLGLFVTWSVLGSAWTNRVQPETSVVTSSDHGDAIAHGETLAQAPTPSVLPTSTSDGSQFVRSATRPSTGMSLTLRRGVPILILAWACGSLLMLLRLSRQLLAARRYLTGTPVDDPRLLAMVEHIRVVLRLRRAIRVLSLPHLPSPLVLGIFAPVLVVPVALLTGLPPEQQFAIVAHELAHVRRWDFLVNLFQLVIEAVLFFNPAVWWLSRQIRIEREACCDAIAVSLTHDPVDYARTLADWADRMRTPAQIALAFAEPSGQGSLVDRVRRVLVPAQAPHLRVRWFSLAGMLALVVAGLFAMARGTDWAVAQAARALSDAERVAVVQAARAEVKIEDDTDLRTAEPVRIRGQVRNEQGEPIPHVNVSAQSQSGNSGHSLGSTANTDGTIDVKIPGGRVRVSIYAKDYAPVLFPERRVAGGEVIDLGEIVVRKGYPARVRFVDPAGQPVSANRISAAPSIMNSWPSATIEADADGRVTLENLIDTEYKLSARAAGYQPVYGWTGKLPADEVTPITMRPAQVTSGRILDEAGQPAAGVAIHCRREDTTSITPNENTSHSYDHGIPGQLWAVTGADGQFRIDQMADGSVVSVMLLHDGVMRGLIEGVRTGDTNLEWTLAPPLTVRGRVTGDLDLIHKDPRYRSIFYSVLRDTHQQTGQQVLSGSFKVAPDGTFEIPNLVTGTLSIRQTYLTVKHPLTASVSDLELPIYAPADQPAPTRRTIMLEFTHDGRRVQPAGQVVLNFYQSGDPRQVVEIMGPETGVEISAGKAVTIDMSAERLLGFLPAKGVRERFEITASQDRLTIPVIPAGIVRGTVVDHDGRPLAGARIGVRLANRSTAGVPEQVDTGSNGEFVVNPMPLTGESYVYARIDRTWIFSEPFVMDAAHPEQQLTLTMPRRRDIRVRVCDPDGKPLANCPLRLELGNSLGRAGLSHGFGIVARTGDDGLASIDGVNVALDGYHLLPPTTGPWLSQRLLLTGADPQDVYLQRGHVIEGTVLDETGAPIPGVTLGASPRYDTLPKGVAAYFEAEGKTDEEGRFRFSNLPAVPVRINAIGIEEPPLPTERWSVPDGEPVVIQGKVADWLRKALDRDQ